MLTMRNFDEYRIYSPLMRILYSPKARSAFGEYKNPHLGGVNPRIHQNSSW